MLNSSTGYVPTDAELQQIAEANAQFAIPPLEGQPQPETAPGQFSRAEFEVMQHYPISGSEIEAQATPAEVRDSTIDLYDDQGNLNYLQDVRSEVVAHDQVRVVDQRTQSTGPEMFRTRPEHVQAMTVEEQLSRNLALAHALLVVGRQQALQERGR